MGMVACDRGCFVCGPAGQRLNHQNTGCCESTRCNESRWREQTRQWLMAEKKWKAKQPKRLAEWLLAEQLYTVQCEQWLAAERDYRLECEQWLVAERAFKATLRPKQARRVMVVAQENRPNTKARAEALKKVHR